MTPTKQGRAWAAFLKGFGALVILAGAALVAFTTYLIVTRYEPFLPVAGSTDAVMPLSALHMIGATLEALTGFAAFKTAKKPGSWFVIVLVSVLSTVAWGVILIFNHTHAYMPVYLFAGLCGSAALVVCAFVQKAHCPPGADKLRDDQIW